MGNTAYIFQPHFITNMFRVAKKDQQGEKVNYIIVTCSPEYNGVWKWPSELAKNLSTWKNGSVDCFEVPIDKCEKINTLDNIKQEAVRSRVIEQQNSWLKSEIKNRNYEYKNKPEWMIGE